MAGAIQPNDVTVGDFNSDGIPDVATANRVTKDVTILLGNGNGGITQTNRFNIAGEGMSISAGDLN